MAQRRNKKLKNIALFYLVKEITDKVAHDKETVKLIWPTIRGEFSFSGP